MYVCTFFPRQDLVSTYGRFILPPPPSPSLPLQKALEDVSKVRGQVNDQQNTITAAIRTMIQELRQVGFSSSNTPIVMAIIIIIIMAIIIIIIIIVIIVVVVSNVEHEKTGTGN